jgi:hypothetical protein
VEDEREDEPTQTTPAGAEIPVPTRKDWERTLDKITKPRSADGPSEIEDAARQELEYPGDESDEA